MTGLKELQGLSKLDAVKLSGVQPESLLSKKLIEEAWTVEDVECMPEEDFVKLVSFRIPGTISEAFKSSRGQFGTTAQLL